MKGLKMLSQTATLPTLEEVEEGFQQWRKTRGSSFNKFQTLFAAGHLFAGTARFFDLCRRFIFYLNKTCELNFQKVCCIANIDLTTRQGIIYFELLDEQLDQSISSTIQ